MKIVLIILSLHVITYAQQLSFEDAWKKLQEKDFALKARDSAIDGAKSLDSSNKSLYLPSISVDGTYTYLGDVPQIDILDLNPIAKAKDFLNALGVQDAWFTTDLMEQHTYQASLSAKYLLFDGFQREAINDISTQEITSKKILKELEIEKLFMNLSTLYYGVVLAKANEKLLSEAKEDVALHVANAKKLYKHEQIAKLELLSAKMIYEDAKVLHKKSQNDLASIQNALNNLMQEKVEVKSELFVFEDFEDQQDYKDKMLKNSNTLKSLKIKSTQSDQLIKLQEGFYYPQVFAFGTYNLYKDDSIIMSAIPKWFVGVGINFDILSPLGRDEKIQAAKLAKNEINFLYKKLQQELKSLTDEVYFKMKSNLDIYYGVDTSIDTAKENLKLQQLAFKESLVSSSEVSDARLFLTQAKTKKMLAAYAYILSYAELLALSGQIPKFIDSSNASNEF
jgi:outer membrane protein TolC